MSLNSLRKPPTPTLLQSLNQKHQIHLQRPLLQQSRCSACHRQYRAFIIRRSATVQIAVPAGEGEGIGGPAFGRGSDDVVVAVEEDSGLEAAVLGSVEGAEDEGAVGAFRGELEENTLATLKRAHRKKQNLPAKTQHPAEKGTS